MNGTTGLPGRWREVRRVAAALALCLALALGVPTAAHAAFPGLNGQIGFSTGPTPDLFAINYDGRLARSVITLPPADSGPKWSPDGKQVAWTSFTPGRPNQMYLADADGGNVRRLAPSRSIDYVEGWSPDGRSILFSSFGRESTHQTELYVGSADGSEVRRLTFRPFEDRHAAWSPDGTTIVWASTDTNPGTIHLYAMNADGSSQHSLTPQNSPPTGDWPAWSPDSRRLVWVSYSGGGKEIWTANADGTGARRLLHSPYELYSPSSRPTGN